MITTSSDDEEAVRRESGGGRALEAEDVLGPTLGLLSSVKSITLAFLLVPVLLDDRVGRSTETIKGAIVVLLEPSLRASLGILAEVLSSQNHSSEREKAPQRLHDPRYLGLDAPAGLHRR